MKFWTFLFLAKYLVRNKMKKMNLFSDKFIPVEDQNIPSFSQRFNWILRRGALIKRNAFNMLMLTGKRKEISFVDSTTFYPVFFATKITKERNIKKLLDI